MIAVRHRIVAAFGSVDMARFVPTATMGSANPFPENEIWSYPERTGWEKVR